MINKAAPVNLTIEEDYDSQFCGSIPLHLVNLIQPHGMLLVLDSEDLKIVQASENVEAYLTVSASNLLNQTLDTLIPDSQFEEIRAKVNRQDSQEKIPLTLTFRVNGQDRAFSAVVLPQQDYILMELEESKDVAPAYFIGLYQNLKYVTSLLKRAQSCNEIAETAAAELKKFSGFDRVLVYQFDPQWNGIVIAQAREEDMDDYLGLRFPASDVPRQARELYFRNPYRLIPTRSYTPVRMIPVINPLTQQFTDLSESSLRSVANVHLEYLANLNVTASMSLPIIIDNKLWGLLSCHHKTAKNPGYEMRSAMELFAGILSAQLEAKQKEENMALRVKLRSVHVKLIEQLYFAPSFAEGLLNGSTNVKDLLDLDGAAITFEGNIFLSGTTPGKQEVKELTSWLRRNKNDGVFVTDTLPALYPYSKDYRQVASGLIAIPINAEQGEFMLGFRQEVLQTVNWGGNPHDAIQMEADGKTYHPRNSFSIYKETVQNTSLPWLPEELEAAHDLRGAVLEKLIKDRY